MDSTDKTEYSDDQRSSNQRQVVGVGVVLFVLLAAATIFGDGSLFVFLTVGLGIVALVALLWWLFAAKKAKPIADPGPDGRRATMWGAVLGIFITPND